MGSVLAGEGGGRVVRPGVAVSPRAPTPMRPRWIGGAAMAAEAEREAAVPAAGAQRWWNAEAERGGTSGVAEAAEGPGVRGGGAVAMATEERPTRPPSGPSPLPPEAARREGEGWYVEAAGAQRREWREEDEGGEGTARAKGGGRHLPRQRYALTPLPTGEGNDKRQTTTAAASASLPLPFALRDSGSGGIAPDTVGSAGRTVSGLALWVAGGQGGEGRAEAESREARDGGRRAEFDVEGDVRLELTR